MFLSACKFHCLKLIIYVYIYQHAKMCIYRAFSETVFIIVVLPQNGTLSTHKKGKTEFWPRWRHR